MINNNFILKKYFNKNRLLRLILLIFIDSLIIIFSIYAAKFLSIDYKFSNYLNEKTNLVIIGLGITIYILLGIYKPLTKYSGSQSFIKYTIANIIFSFILFLSPIKIFVNYQTYIIFALVLSSLSIFSRLCARYFIFKKFKEDNLAKKNIAIYGAGEAGAQLLAAISLSSRYNIVTFLDDKKSLWKRTINGIPIKPRNYLESNSRLIDQVFLAIPSLNSKKRKEIFYYLSQYKIPVLQIPSIDELLKQKKNIDTLQPIPIEDLLGRDVTPPDSNLLQKNIINSTVFVSGAGGSIGSELCRQLIRLKPSKIIIFEISEINLYQINEEIKNCLSNNTQLIPILGNAQFEKQLNSIFVKHKVDFVFHTAAYKHVPLVEENVIEGIKNNIFTTNALCSSVLKNNIKNFVLISTDKAVRPTNVMGASKRVSELIVKSFAKKAKDLSKRSIFSVVRFGNVLDSSGSVIPLFRKQISDGGPITLTHKNIERYFMTITEAAELVLYASAMAKGGEIFLLEMGKPVRIFKLAEQMILLSGKTIKDKLNPKGEIEIKITGLRSGEKLYEELLIDKKSKSTDHALIFRAVEHSVDDNQLWENINRLKQNIKEEKLNECLINLSELVPEWTSKTYIIGK